MGIDRWSWNGSHRKFKMDTQLEEGMDVQAEKLVNLVNAAKKYQSFDPQNKKDKSSLNEFVQIF